VDLSSINLNTLSLNGTGYNNTPTSVNITLGSNSEGIDSLIISGVN
jgi:hypothetical protein